MLLDSSSETRKAIQSWAANSIRAYINSKWLIQLFWYAIVQRLEKFCSRGVGWHKNVYHMSSCISSWKIYAQTSTVVLSTSVDLPTWIVYHGDSLILSNSYASISSTVSSIPLVMLLPKRGTCATFKLQSLLKFIISVLSSKQDPLFTNSKRLLAFKMQLVTENDALGADKFDEVVSFNNCFWFLCSCFFFFWKTPKACLLMHGAWSPSGKAVLKVHAFCWTVSHHILYKAGVENQESPGCNRPII